MNNLGLQFALSLCTTALQSSGLLGPSVVPADDQLFNQIVRERYSEFFVARGMRPDVIIANSSEVTGTNFFTLRGRASIGVPKELLVFAPDTFGFLLKRQVGRLVNNDNLTTIAFQSTVSLVARYLGRKYEEDHKILLTCGVSAIALTTQALATRYRCIKADDFAIEHSTNAELTGARTMFLAEQTLFSQIHNQNMVGRIVFTADGDRRVELGCDPSITSRLAKVEAAMIARGMGEPTGEGQAVVLPMPTDEVMIAVLRGLGHQPQA